MLTAIASRQFHIAAARFDCVQTATRCGSSMLSTLQRVLSLLGWVLRRSTRARWSFLVPSVRFELTLHGF